MEVKKVDSEKTEKLVKNERRNSLAALLRAIKFRKPANGAGTKGTVSEHFAQPRFQFRQHAVLADDSRWVRSAN